MNPRIEKKVSKRLVETAPRLFKGAWIDDSVEWWPKYWKLHLNRELTKLENKRNKQRERSRVNNVCSIGGGLDYWGEGQDWYTCLEFMRNEWPWIGKFESYPEGHEFSGYPNTGNFKPTTRNLIKLAREHG